MLLESYTYKILLKEKDEAAEASGEAVTYVIRLEETNSPHRVQNFKIVKTLDGLPGLYSHMESLTDANCEQWFPKQKKPK